jgi:hypothetical protein
MSCLLCIPCMYDIYSTLQLSCQIETIGRSSECMYAPIYSKVDILLLIRGQGRAGEGRVISIGPWKYSPARGTFPAANIVAHGG